MNVIVNGSDQEMPDGATVRDVVDVLHLPAARGVAVARNGDVVLRSLWEETPLTPGDRIEVLHAVQGG